MDAGDPSWGYLIDQAARCLVADDRTGAEVHLTAALALAREAEDARRVATSLVELGALRNLQRRHSAAERLLLEAIAILEATGDAAELGRAREELERARA